jgi:hypothetical protein
MVPPGSHSTVSKALGTWLHQAGNLKNRQYVKVFLKTFAEVRVLCKCHSRLRTNCEYHPAFIIEKEHTRLVGKETTRATQSKESGPRVQAL